MLNCHNKVSQFIPRGFFYKEIFTPCGSTSIQGDTLLCEECEFKCLEQYPQGWREHPGDLCRHGTYVGDRRGDYVCAACEAD